MPEDFLGQYLIGSGKVFVSFNGGLSFIDLGSCPDFEVSMKVDELEHKNYRSGAAKTDFKIVTGQSASGKCTIETFSSENLNMFLMGNGAANSSQASGNITDQELTVSAMNASHDLGKLNISALVVKNAGETVTYEFGTDYEVDLRAGLIKPIGSTILKDDVLNLAYTCALTTIQKVASGKSTTMNAEIKFVGDPAKGPIYLLRGEGTIVPSGSLKLIGKDTASFQIDITFVQGGKYDGFFEIDQIGTV